MEDLNALIQDLKNLAEIQRLLDDAYDHYFEHSDGYCKPSEGWLQVDFGNYFYRKQENVTSLKVAEVKIYSYVFSSYRMHDFATTAEALAAVQEWHREEMSNTHEDDF